MSSQGRSASSGVRNLRAMFENKDDSTTSPPQHRGRSPAPSIGNNSASPRPLSKVRTSFVAVERNGQTGIQWGLRKETTVVPPEEPTMSHRRGSFAENETTDPDVVIERKKSIQEEFKARKNSIDISETIPEFALEMPSSKQGTPTLESKDPMPAAHTPTGNPDKSSTVEDRNAKLLPADVKSAAAVSGGKALKGASGIGEDLKGITTGKLKTASSAKAGDKAGASKSSKPAPISTSKTSTLAKSSKSPALPKTPISSTSTKSSTKTTTTTTTTTAPKATKPTTTTTKPVVPSTRATAAPKKAPLPSTKPAKLPSSLTAPTSSSLSKVTDDARRTSAGSTRSPSRVSGGPVTRKAPSRPSLGPPPAAAGEKGQRQSLPKQADEGFLARMMRPTTASRGKAIEKGTGTPPKPRVVGVERERPGTRNGVHGKGGMGREGNGSPVARPPVPTVGAVPTLKPLSAKATAGKTVGAKKAEVAGKKEVPAPTSEPATAPAVGEKSEEPITEAVSVSEPAAPVEQDTEPAVVEETAEEEVVAAPATTAEETVPAQTEVEVEIDEPVSAADIEDAAPVTPVEETTAEDAAPVEETPEVTEEVTGEVVSEVPTGDGVVSDKIDVSAVVGGGEETEETEEPVVDDKVDVAAVVSETEVEEAEEAKAVAEIPVVVEAEIEVATEETPAVEADIKADTKVEAAGEDEDEGEEIVEPTAATTSTLTTTAATAADELETAELPTTTATATTTEEETSAKEKSEVEVEEVEEVTTPVKSEAGVVAL